MHFICTGHPRIVGVSARQIKSEGCPNNEFFWRIIKIEFYRKLVQRIVLGNRPQFTSERPMNCCGELPNKFTSEDCPTYLYRRVAHN